MSSSNCDLGMLKNLNIEGETQNNDKKNMDFYRSYIRISKYARWLTDKNRRETWDETVTRFCNFIKENLAKKRNFTLTDNIYKTIYDAIYNQEIMPSMRALATAGKALELENASGYNCAYRAINDPYVFPEMLYILMCGTGMGYSVERQNINQLPMIPDNLVKSEYTTQVEDSKLGWAQSYKELIDNLYNGLIIKWDVSKVRPKGSILKTFGGRSSGPAYLVNLFEFTIKTFIKAKGRKLESIECHDLCCKIADVVVSGGIRRSVAKGTRVMVKTDNSDSSYIPIEEITEGDIVYSNVGARYVTQVFNNGIKPCIKVNFQGGSIIVTPDHELAVVDHYDIQKLELSYFWKRADSLKDTDILFMPNYNTPISDADIENQIVKAYYPKKFLSIEEVKEPQETWDIEVEGSHCFIAEGILSHNSALLSLSNLSDLRMRDAKSGAWWEKHPYRAFANNSVAYTEKPGPGIFMEEWLSLFKSQSGERGIFNRRSAKDVVMKIGRRDPNHEFGCNPCVSIDTWVATDKGHIQVLDLIGRRDYKIIVNGMPYDLESNGFFHTGEKQLYEISLENGLTLKATDYHPIYTPNGKISLKDLKIGDIIVLNNHSSFNVWQGMGGTFNDGIMVGKSADFSKLLEQMSSEFYRGFLQGTFDKNSSISQIENTIKLVGMIDNLKVIQRMLLRLCIMSWINKNPLTEYSLLIKGNENLLNFSKSVNYGDNKKEKLNNIIGQFINTEPDQYNFTSKIEKIEKVEVANVYDVTVKDIHQFDANGLLVSNCSEILLRDCEFCNLSEVIVRPSDTKEDLLRKVRIATIVGTIQASWTDFKFISPKWKENCDEEALLGVSLTGILDNKMMAYPSGELRDILTELKFEAIKTNREWASKIGINQSAAITCVKPAGCLRGNSLLCTDRGIITMEEIGAPAGAQWQNHNIQVATDEEPSKSDKFYVNGMAPTKKISFKTGTQIECTLDHKFKVFNEESKTLEWKEAKNINLGDIIPYKIGSYKKCSSNSYMPFKIIRNSDPTFKQPPMLNEDLAWLLGMYYCDGTPVQSHGISISGELRTENYLLKAGEMFLRYFGIKNWQIMRSSTRPISLFIVSPQFIQWLDINGLSKKSYNEMEIPLVIRRSPIGVIESFINSYWPSEGCTHHITKTKTWSVYNPTMAAQLITILRYIGINCTMRTLYSDQQTQYCITECKCHRKFKVDIETELNPAKIDTRNPIDKLNSMFKKFEELNFREYIPDMVTNIEDGECLTFDIQVPGKHHYQVQGGYISHNTTSQLTDSASGIHPRYSKYYIRTVRGNNDDPLTKFMIESGIPNEPDCMVQNTTVFSFPIKAPKECRQRADITALEHLDLWLLYQTYWCEHKPSITVNIKDDEWLKVASWVYDNFDKVSGIAFLPYAEDIYKQAPYQEITKEEYETALVKMPKAVDWSKLSKYEKSDNVKMERAWACTGNSCSYA